MKSSDWFQRKAGSFFRKNHHSRIWPIGPQSLRCKDFSGNVIFERCSVDRKNVETMIAEMEVCFENIESNYQNGSCKYVLFDNFPVSGFRSDCNIGQSNSNLLVQKTSTEILIEETLPVVLVRLFQLLEKSIMFAFFG